MNTTMNKGRREDIWERFDFIAGQATLLRDGVHSMLRRDARHDYLDQITDLRDRLAQISEMIEETIEVEA